MTKPEALQVLYGDNLSTQLTKTGYARFVRALRVIGFTEDEIHQAERDAEYRDSNGSLREFAKKAVGQ